MSLTNDVLNAVLTKCDGPNSFTTGSFHAEHFPETKIATISKLLSRLRKQGILEYHYGMYKLNTVTNLSSVIEATTLASMLNNAAAEAALSNKRLVVYITNSDLEFVKDENEVLKAVTISHFNK